MRKQLLHKFTKMRLYYLKKSSNDKLYANYYLLGFREKYVFLSINSVVTSLTYFRSFCQKANWIPSSIWITCFDVKFLPLTRWVASITNASYFITYMRGGLLIYFRGKFFWVEHKFFSHRLLHAIGASLFILPIYTPRAVSFFQPLQNSCIPSTGLVPLGANVNLTFPFYVNLEYPSHILFFLRFIFYCFK